MNYWMGVAITTGINLIAILGVSILTGFTGLFSFGHGGFMAIGAYVSAISTQLFHIPPFVGIILGVFTAVIVGILIGYPALRLKGDYFVIATLGFGEVVRLVIENAQTITGGARGLSDVAQTTTFPTVVVLDIVVLILLSRFIHSRHGRNCIAIREEEIAAQAMGIEITRYKVIAMAISCALTGLAGALLGHFIGYLHPAMFGMVKSNELILTVILGGQGSLTGSTLACLILSPLPELLRIEAAQEWRMVVYGLLVILIILFRPGGILGYKELSIRDIKRFFKWIASGRMLRRNSVGK